MRFSLLSLLFVFLMSCGPKQDSSQKSEELPVFSLKEIPEAFSFSGEPALYKTPDGSLLLSYFEYTSDSTSSIVIKRWIAGAWLTESKQPPRADYFVNWADFPQLSSFDNEGMDFALGYLQYHGETGHAYDAKITTGEADFLLHNDGKAAEHGFISLLPTDSQYVFASWLDGRNAALHDTEDGGHHHGGDMTLRAAFFDKNGKLFQEAELDNRVCDCCQTDAVMGPDGPIVVYRDRNQEEIRDIYCVRYKNGKWSSPTAVHHDGWEISGCPVNGPAIAAAGAKVAVVWIDGSVNLDPKILAAVSKNGGKDFAKPLRLDIGRAAGRVNITRAGKEDFLAIWMEYTETRAALYGRLLSQNQSFEIMEYDATRLGGFPAIESIGENEFLIAYTNVDQEETSVKTSILILE